MTAGAHIATSQALLLSLKNKSFFITTVSNTITTNKRVYTAFIARYKKINDARTTSNAHLLVVRRSILLR